MDSDLDEELLGIAEGKPRKASGSKKRGASPDQRGAGKRKRAAAPVDPDETESERADEDDEEDDDEDEDGEGEMDLDVESEDGYDPSTRPAPRSGEASTSGGKGGAASPAGRPAAVKRTSSSKTKQAKAPAKKAAPAKASKAKAAPAKKGQAVKRTTAGSKAKPAADKGLSASLYPLEGKYKDEEDRDYLDRLPEIEREEILAARLEEKQREIDRQALGDLYKQTVGKLDEDEAADEDSGEDMDMDIDEDDDEVKAPPVELDLDLPRKPGKKDITSNAISALKERRQARSNRAERSDRPAGRLLGDADFESDNASSEEGSYDDDRDRRGYRRRGDSDSDDAYMGDGGRRRRGKRDDYSPKQPELPVTPEDLNGVRLSRWELVDIKHRDFFKEMAVGAFVKCSSGVDANQRLKYRVFEIIDVEPEGATYRIEYKGKDVPENRKLLLRYGNVNKAYKMSDVSNQPFDNHEFVRWKATTEADKQPVPSKSKLRAKHNQMKELRDRPWTEAEIQNKLTSYQAHGQMSSTKAAVKRSRLISELELAKRSDDHEWLARAQEELDTFEASLGESGRGNGAEEGVNKLLAKVNEKNKRDAAETARRAHKADQIRRKLTDEMGMLDPSARVKMKMYKHDAGIPEALAKSLQELEQKKLGQANSAQQEVSEVQAVEAKPSAPLRRLDAVVASTVDLDLGDF